MICDESHYLTVVAMLSFGPPPSKHVNIREFMPEMYPNTATLAVAHVSRREIGEIVPWTAVADVR